MKWLLDTNVVSESLRPQPDRRVLAWIAAHPGDQLAISVLALAELRSGVAMLHDDSRRSELERWFDTYVNPTFGERILPVTLDILIDWLQLSRLLQLKGRPRAAVDMLVASTARVHDLIVVSPNTRHFANTGVVLYDPWTGRTHAMDAP